MHGPRKYLMNLLRELKRLFAAGVQRFKPPSRDPESLFTEQRRAVKEISERRKNTRLKKDVRDYLTPAGKVFADKITRPSALLFRQVGSPTNEILRFFRIAKHAGLYPILLEYHGDKFVSAGNSYKRSLGKMPLYKHTGLDGRDIVEYRTVVDFNSSVGKPLSSIICKDGKPLIEFHHKLLAKTAGIDVDKHCIDATDWFRECGGSAREYYEQFLSLFIRDGILFEVILPTASEEQFARSVMSPAFASIEDRFGQRPLIVELIPRVKSARTFWDAYPAEVARYL